MSEKKASPKKTSKKKAENKSAVKKKTVKRAPTKAQRIKSLSKKAPEERVFILSSGEQITSLKQLALELDGISDEVFYYHVNDSKNDFYNWIKEVFDEMELAEDILDKRNKADFHIQLLKYYMKFI